MKNLLSLLAVFICFNAFTQTLSPWLDEMNSIGQPGDQWRLVTGQPNTGAHNGEMCYNVVGTYLDDEYYSFESDTLDFSLWSQVDVEFTIASSLRNNDVFAFYYYDSATSSWGGYGLSGLVGTYTVTIPTTTILLSFDLSTFSNGNTNGKYAHVDRITLSDPATPLPIELLYFDGENKDNINILSWASASESNADYYEVEWSTDAVIWWPIGDLPAAGNSNMTLEYSFKHEDYREGVYNYYRLVQYDYDGQFEIFDIIAIDNTRKEKRIVRYVNLSGQVIDPESTIGLVIGIYEDGTSTTMWLR